MQSAIASEQKNLKYFCCFMHSLDVTKLRSSQTVGKKNTWSTWHNFDELTETFVKLSSSLTIKAVTDAMPVLERFVVLMYDRMSNCLDVNSCHLDLFVKKGWAMKALPPTFAALLQHNFCAAYQAGHVWWQSLNQQQQLPSSEGMENGWRNVFSSLDWPCKSCHCNQGAN